MRPTEEGKGSVSGVEILKREVERGREGGGRGVVKKDRREVECGKEGRGERGGRGTSFMGWRMLMKLW